jgi:hypothetical protein
METNKISTLFTLPFLDIFIKSFDTNKSLTKVTLAVATDAIVDSKIILLLFFSIFLKSNSTNSSPITPSDRIRTCDIYRT